MRHPGRAKAANSSMSLAKTRTVKILRTRTTRVCGRNRGLSSSSSRRNPRWRMDRTSMIPNGITVNAQRGFRALNVILGTNFPMAPLSRRTERCGLAVPWSFPVEPLPAGATLNRETPPRRDRWRAIHCHWRLSAPGLPASPHRIHLRYRHRPPRKPSFPPRTRRHNRARPSRRGT